MNIDEVLLILNSLIYSDGFNNSTKNNFENIYELVIDKKFSKPDDMNASKEEWDALLKTVKANKTYFSNIKIVDVSTKDGYEKNTAFINNNVKGSQLYVVYAGTGSGEWHDNALGGSSLNSSTPQQKNALAYTERISSLYPNYPLYVSGHSKGGNKAQYVAILFDRVVGAYSFDGQGMGPGFLLKYKNLIDANAHKITSISNQSDFVNPLFKGIAGKVKFTTNSKSLLDLIMGGDLKTAMRQHSPLTMFKIVDGKLKMQSTTSVQDPAAEFVGNLVQYFMKHMSEEDFRILSNLIMHNLESDICGDKDFDPNAIPSEFFIRMINHIVAYGNDIGLSNDDIVALILNMDKIIGIDDWKVQAGLILGKILINPKELFTGKETMKRRLANIFAKGNAYSRQGGEDIVRDFSSTMQEIMRESLSSDIDITDLVLSSIRGWHSVANEVNISGAETSHQALFANYVELDDCLKMTKSKYDKIIEDVYEKDAEFADKVERNIGMLQEYIKKFDEYKVE